MSLISSAATVSLSILMVAGFACGGEQGAAPTPTVTAEPTATVEETVQATPTQTFVNCPPPSEGKGNIAGIILWNEGSWVDEFGTRAILDLYPTGSHEDIAGLKYLEGVRAAKTTADIDGNFCFRNIEPGEYFISRGCPNVAYLGVYINVTVTEGETYWLSFDPHGTCTNPRY